MAPYLVERLHQLLEHYRELPESVQHSGDSLSMIEALKAGGEPIKLLEYKSETLQLSTLTVENLVSFTEKIGPETSLRAANQLLDFIQNLLRLLKDFSETYSPKKRDIDIVETLKTLNGDLIHIYEAPYCVTIEIKKVVSFTAKSKTKCADDCIDDAARDMVHFLGQLAKVN